MKNIERETKLQVSGDDFQRLRSAGRIQGVADQLNVYYDSSDRLSRSCSTFRVRFSPGHPPLVTLKLPHNEQEGIRESIEIEDIARRPIFKGSVRGRCLVVESDLPYPVAATLRELGIEELRRVGWMRNTRWVITLPEDPTPIELDETHLPDGTVLYEAEIEGGDREHHIRLVQHIRKVATSAVPSSMSKFQRFVFALRRKGD
jgi:uncharacterized protein YjbK